MKPVVLLLLGWGLAAGLPAWTMDRQAWTVRYPLPPASRLTVENVQGDIAVQGWDRAEVEMTVTKTGMSPGSRLSDVRVAIELGDRSLDVRTVYSGETKGPVRVDYQLRVPRQVRLNQLQNVDGNIMVLDVEGSVNARTLNGSIAEMNVAGQAAAGTVNGNVYASLGALPGPGDSLEFETLSGNVDLVLPPRPNADVELQTVAGKINSRYAFIASRVPGDSTRRVRLGRGGPRVRLRTVRGNIRVTERDDVL